MAGSSRRDALTNGVRLLAPATVLAPVDHSRPVDADRRGRPARRDRDRVDQPIRPSASRVLPIVDGKPQPVDQSRRARGAGRRQRAASRRPATLVVTRAAKARTHDDRRQAARAASVQTLTLSRDEPTDRVRASATARSLASAKAIPPQFDRRGMTYPSRNGQGGINSARVAGAYRSGGSCRRRRMGRLLHQPLGSFDLVAALARSCHSDALPFDVFVVAADDPKAIVGEYARITGHAELPPLWSFGYMQSHRTLAGPERNQLGRAHVSREEAAVRRADLLGTKFTPSGGTRATASSDGRRRTFPIREVHRRDARAALQGRAPHRHRRAAHERRGRRSVHARQGGAERRTPDDHWPRQSRGAVLLACTTSRSTISASMACGPIRAMALMSRRGWRASACIGKAAAIPSERAAVRAASQRHHRACSVTAPSSGRVMYIRSGRR